MELEAAEENKATKKIRGREGQSLFDKMLEKDDFISVLRSMKLTIGGTPLYHIPIMKKTLQNQKKEIRFGALTLVPVTFRGLGPLLSLAFLELVHSHALEGSGEAWRRCAGGREGDGDY